MASSPSFIFGGSTGQTPESLKRQREAAQQSMAAGSSTAPVSGAVEAVARALQGGIGGYFDGQAEREQNYAALPSSVKDAAKAAPAFDGFAQASGSPYSAPNAPLAPAAPSRFFRLGTFGLGRQR